MHYRISEGGTPRPYTESHAPVVGWRLALLPLAS